MKGVKTQHIIAGVYLYATSIVLMGACSSALVLLDGDAETLIAVAGGGGGGGARGIIATSRTNLPDGRKCHLAAVRPRCSQVGSALQPALPG